MKAKIVKSEYNLILFSKTGIFGEKSSYGGVYKSKFARFPTDKEYTEQTLSYRGICI